MSFATTYEAFAGVSRYRLLMKRHGIALLAVATLLIGTLVIRLGGSYWFDRSISLAPTTTIAGKVAGISGLNSSVDSAGLQAKIQAITSQPGSLNLGTKTVPIDASTIRSWLKVTQSRNGSDGIHIDAKTIASSLGALVKSYEVAPVNQVTSTAEGSPRVIVAGQNGYSLSPSANINAQADQLAKSLMSDKGFQVNAPLVINAYQAVTTATFPKLIEVDVNTKMMYVFQNGQIIRTFPVSAGAPATPTPLGEFHIYAKYPVQDMWGYNVNGTKYFQPHVYWVNYFDGGDAVHGVYWHPLSWFGVHNSSHGCVGVSDDNGEWIYNWAPIGTTVITHA